MPRAHFHLVALEPNPNRWALLRDSLGDLCPQLACAPGPADACGMLGGCDVEILVVGTHGHLDEHHQLAAMLAAATMDILVVADRGTPQRVAAYLRLGPHVRVVAAEPRAIRQAVIDLRRVPTLAVPPSIARTEARSRFTAVDEHH